MYNKECLVVTNIDDMKKVNVTKHALERWCERILNMVLSEIPSYISAHRDKLIADINETFYYSELIYKGQLGTDNITRHYYIQNDIVFITNTDDNAIITMYKVDLGFTPELNTTVRKGLLDEIVKLQEKKYTLDCESLSLIDDMNFEINSIDDNIKVIEQQLLDLKMQKKLKLDAIKSINLSSNVVNGEINKYVLMLVNSKEYKKDIQTI